MLFKSIAYAEESKYEANYNPLNCKGIAFEYNGAFLAEWNFKPTGGSGSLITIKYNKLKRYIEIYT